MTYEILFSPTGGTMKTANLLTKEFSSEVRVVDLMDRKADFSSIPFTPEDLCVVAVPSFGGRIPAPAAVRMAQMQGNGAKAILMAVYGNRTTGDMLLELKDILTKAGFRPVAALEAVARHSLFPQFAAGRPDSKDHRELVSFASQIKEKLAAESSEELTVPGSFPYQEYTSIPLKPKADHGCVRCGHCARHCPVGAIPLESPNQTNTQVCITCMACTAFCPQRARKISPLVLFPAALALRKSCKGRKPNKLYL
ncbi:MAG: 4Fe-4S dicluster domain-containing protein [Ruminiclostridium sp.]|nr:4Fe-4S dicluster domain-containing protein [Ruminiclostridium sp.]